MYEVSGYCCPVNDLLNAINIVLVTVYKYQNTPALHLQLISGSSGAPCL